MDEVDVDDLNELEARLYGQIHHEASNADIDNAARISTAAVGFGREQQQQQQQSQEQQLSGGRTVTKTSVINRQAGTSRVPTGRYWIGGQDVARSNFTSSNANKLLANPFKAPQSSNAGKGEKNGNVEAATSGAATAIATAPTSTKTTTKTVTIAKKTNETAQRCPVAENTTKPTAAKEPQNVSTDINKPPTVMTTEAEPQSKRPNTANVESTPNQQSPSTSTQSKAKQGTATADQQQKPPPNISKQDLRINPAAAKAKGNKKHKNKQKTAVQQTTALPNILKNGPFAKQVHKLQKAQLLEEKKQKSKRVQEKQRNKKQQHPCETIVLDVSDESESDDVILVNLPPPPVLTVYDSDEAEEQNHKGKVEGDDDKKEQLKAKTPTFLEMEENALDASDVALGNSRLSEITFAKPQVSATSFDKNLDNSSRCTSPSSVLSTDDFIGQHDRLRLLEGSGMADDEDLLLLTADVDSLMEIPRSSVNKVKVTNVERIEPANRKTQNNSDEEVEFVSPIASNIAAAAAKISNYRVDQSQFRALDVSESDVDTDNVYCKGKATTKKATVIRSIGSSSSDSTDDVEIIATCQKTKRLNKRLASGSNKESEINVDDLDSGSEDDGGMPTGVPGISRGPAVERIKSKPRRTSWRIPSTGGASTGQMSDGEFIATLNNLAQGGTGDLNEEDDSDDIDAEIAAPTAREMAAKVLMGTSGHRRRSPIQQHLTTAGVVTERSISESDVPDVPPPPPPAIMNITSAVPDDVLAELDRVFETIDTLDERDKRTSPDDIVEVDPPDVEPETTADNCAQTSEVSLVVANNVVSPRLLKPKRDIGHPIYNIIYSRGGRLPGGIGWNDEMRRFYNSSWKGEHFSLQQTWSKMNPSKNIWKVYTEDRFPKDRRFKNLKCFNCCEFGHTRAKCKRPRKPLVCYMCGEHGHHEPRCPNTICLRCGNKTHVFTKSCNACTFQNRLICPVCKVRGHTLNLCPDKWRRYHSTTEPNTYPNSQVEYKNKKFCCVCGGRGHLSENCKSAVRFNEYPIIVSEIKSHQKSYNDQTIRIHQTGVGFNLLYNPSEDLSFELAENTSGDKYYGRFLKAVGMGYMLKRKRKLSITSPIKRVKKQQQEQHQQYVTNPYSKAGQKERNNAEPDQVPEVSESGNLDAHNVNGDDAVMEIDATEISSDSESVEILGTVVEVEQAEVVIEEIVTNAEDTAQPQESIDIIVNTNDQTMEEENIVIMNDVSITETNETAVIADPNEESNERTNLNGFKAPTDVPASLQSPKDKEPLPMDSDSNYSFSEHFEMPSTSAAAASKAAALAMSSQQKSRTRVMSPLPDFIPLSDAMEMPEVEDEVENDYDDDNDNNDLDKTGVSRRFVTASDSDEDARLSPLPHLPCEAKIYLTHFHSKFMLSPEGHKFLLTKCEECGIKGRLDWTSVGHVLVIFGLRTNQDHFHRELLLKYRELTDQMNRKRVDSFSSLKVPRRIDVLVRFLRENITQLSSNLGNVNDLLKRLRHHENLQSKTSSKMAEKTRRLLNMILLGQAGLVDGSLHLDKLLLNLKALINDYKSEDVAPNELRNEIEGHWKAIFTPYRHSNYPNLVQNYNRMTLKNRVPKLNIDPALLGQKILDTSLTAGQKERLEQQPQQKPQQKSTANQDASVNSSEKQTHNIVPNPLNPKNSKLLQKKPQNKFQNVIFLNSPTPPFMRKSGGALTQIPVSSPSKAPPAPSMKTRDNSNSKTQTPNKQTKAIVPPPTPPLKKQTIVPPCANPEQKSNVVTTIKTVAQKLESTCENLLTEIDNSDSGCDGNAKNVQDCKTPSMFWSRESMKYLDHCIRLAKSGRITGISEKLQRVQNKSQTGSLSYNDYRAVIKLHNAMLGK